MVTYILLSADSTQCRFVYLERKRASPNCQLEAWTGAIFVKGSLQLYDGGSRYALLKQSLSNIRSEQIQLERMKREISAQIRGSLTNIANQKQTVKKAHKMSLLAKSAHEDTATLLSLGFATPFDFLDSTHKLSKAMREYELSQFQLNQTRLDLTHILGLLEPELMLSKQE